MPGTMPNFATPAAMAGTAAVPAVKSGWTLAVKMELHVWQRLINRKKECPVMGTPFFNAAEMTELNGPLP